MGNKKCNLSIFAKALASVALFVAGTMSVYALPGFVVDGANSTNSTGPCVGKTVCHISGDLTYSDITLVNGGKLSHRQGTLTVSNNFVIGWTGSTGSGFFVGQNLTVGNQLVMRGDSVLALNSNLTSDPASNNISDWMGASYYDLQVTNTNLSFTGMDVNLSGSCTTLGGGTTLSACIQTRNVNINSKLSASASSTNVVWKTYANGYISVDGDTTLTNIKTDIAGYLFVQGNIFGSYSSSHYLYVYGGQLISTPDAVGFTTAGIRVDKNMYLTGSASLPDLYMQGANGTAADNIYVSGSLTSSQMSLGLTSKTTLGSLANITVKNGYLDVSGSDTVYFNGNLYAGTNITLTNNTTLDGNNVTSNAGNINVTTGTTHSYGVITVTNGTLTMSGITTLNRNGNTVAKSNISVSNVTTSNGTTNVTSNAGNVTISNGTTHAYGDITVSSGTLAITGVSTLNRIGNINASSDITLTNIFASSGATTDITSTSGNITFNSGSTHTYEDISALGNVTYSGITTSLSTRVVSNSGTTTALNVLLYNRLGNITTKNDIIFTNVTTSSGSSTDLTSTAGNITVTTGTTHTYNNIVAYKDHSITSVTSYSANNISTNGGLIVNGSTVNITNTTDASDESKSNIDISTGSGIIFANSTANLKDSSIQSNGSLDINATTWTSQNLNINGYTNMSYGTGTERVSIYFRGNKDRIINGTVFAGGGSIWVGSSATPDDGNIFLRRKAGVTTNGHIRMFRSTATIIDSYNTAPDVVPTINTGLFTQLYNAALVSNSGSVTILSGSTSNAINLIDGNTTTSYESTTAGSLFRVDFARDMIVSKLCVTTGVNSPENIKLQFLDNSNAIINTQAQKIPTANQTRQCFDLNSYKARKILVSGYGSSSTLGFKEIEFYGVPADDANISTPFDYDILLQNGSFELGGIVTSKNLSVLSASTKKIRLTQYHNSAVFNNKTSINLASVDAGGTTLTHSVGNEIGLKFVTDTMNVGSNVTLDTAWKGYLWGNAKTDSFTSSLWNLYTFSSHLFTNCWATGRYGPSLANCRSAYSSASWAQDTTNNYLNMSTNGIQEWTVPVTGTYTIDAQWANGGQGTTQYMGGNGARMKWDFVLNKGDVIQILVGQAGPTANSNDGGGGGGTFVVKKTGNVPLIIAWGGGGGSYSSPGAWVAASVSTSGTSGANGGAGGTGGAGWSSIGCSGAGGWFTGNWQNGPSCSSPDNGWLSFANGGIGWNGGLVGGFWGGGGTNGGWWGGGGGGGYSGGGASTSSQFGWGGGASYNAGSNQVNIAGPASISSSTIQSSVWNGLVLITYQDPGQPANVIAGGTGNISPGNTRIWAGDGGLFGGFGGYGVSGGGGGGGGGLYAFSSHTFTNCGQTGNTGPSLATCRSSYGAGIPWTQDATNNYLNMTTNGIQEWIVPLTGTYSIDAYGAWVGSYGGGWARIKWDFLLTRGQKLKILVGQQWYNDSASQTSGNGGTFITTIDNVPLVVAGGGGAGYYPTQNYTYSAWQTTTYGGNGIEYGGQQIKAWVNGNGGSCWNNYTTCQGAGGWLTGNGAGTWFGYSFINGGAGGCYSTCGWFGWGGGTTSWYGGGGGGYSGGGAWYNGSNQNYMNGGGGGSYNAGANQINTSGARVWHGQVIITLSGGGAGGIAAAAGAGNLWYGGNGGSATCTGSIGNNSLGNTKWGNGWWALGWSGSNWHGGGGQMGCTGGGGGTGWNSDANPYRLGSGGWAGGLVNNNYTVWYGWNGGGMIRISANTLTLSGKLAANGLAGKDYLSSTTAIMGAGAGGAGGSILIRAKSLTCIAGNSIEAKGGAGGAGGSGANGGGGAGGGVITYYYTDKSGTCNGTVIAGSGGLNGGAADGQAGLIYESVGTTFDTLKSRVTVENSPAAADGTQAVTIRAYFLDVNGVPLESEYLVAEVVGDIGTGKINAGNPLPQTDANGMLSFPITSTVKGIKKIVLKNAVTYTELQEQPTFTFGIPQISIAKVADKSSVDSGDVVTYTITLTNSGSGDAGGDTENAIVVEDVLPTWFTYFTVGPTAGSKWDTGSGTTQYYLFPEVTGDGTAGNEQRLRYTIADGLSGPPNISSGGGKMRILFDVKAP